MKQLTVLIQASNTGLTRLIDRAFDALVTARTQLMTETGLTELSIFRGDLEFCLATLKKKRDYPVIAILDETTYEDVGTRDSVLDAGAKLVYNFTGNSEAQLILRIRECVRDFVGGR